MAKTKQTLSIVPVYFLVDMDLTSGKAVRAGQVEFIPHADASYCAQSRVGLIYAACSVMKRCRGIDPSGAIVPLPPEDAERLEAEGSIKILRDDAEVQRHKDIWAAHQQRFLELRNKVRAMHQEADRLGRDISRSTFLPEFDWDKGESASAA